MSNNEKVANFNLQFIDKNLSYINIWLQVKVKLVQANL